MHSFIKKHSQFIKFLLVGGYNTVVGYACFAFLFFLLPKVHYLLIALISNFISILNAFIAYKYIVFKTKGNHFKEYLKFNFVYLWAFLINLVLLLFLVEICRIHPLLAQAMTIGVTAVISYHGHRNFSFSKKHAKHG
jgi:putative flippase GtrA